MVGSIGNGSTIIKDRFLGFLIWQSLHSTLIYFLFKTLVSPSITLTTSIFSFIFFQLSLLIFSTSLFLIQSPQIVPGVSFGELVFGLLKLVFVYGGGGEPLPPDFRRRVRVTLGFLVFLVSSGVSGFLAVVCLCGFQFFGTLGFRGLLLGLSYGLHYVFIRRWVLDFPIIQRPPFFSYKMGVPKAIVKAIRLSSAGYLVSSLVLPVFVSGQKLGMGDFVVEQIGFYFASYVVFLCWELNRHLLQVFLTKRYIFAPPKGSAAAEMNPSDHLLAALEKTATGSLVSHLAYLDLCMVSESNVDTWRRAAFFEETGDTYKKVMAACLKPLERLTLDLGEALGSSIEKTLPQLSHQLNLTIHFSSVSRSHEPFYDFQVCAWCARIASSLTIRSHEEDRFGVAQISGSNAATVSTLLACLLAVETLMGKKTNLQASNQYLTTSPANIKWAALSPAPKRDPTSHKKDRSYYAKAYSMADILRTSIYQILSTFHQEMVTSSKTGLLEKDWITGKPLYGSHELLVHKLRMFLEFQAN